MPGLVPTQSSLMRFPIAVFGGLHFMGYPDGMKSSCPQCHGTTKFSEAGGLFELHVNFHAKLTRCFHLKLTHPLA